jgi:hypothetical protein
MATASRLAPPWQRGQAISAYFMAGYCGLVIPVIGVGGATEFTGDFPAVLVLSVLLAALCAGAFVGISRARASGATESR